MATEGGAPPLSPSGRIDVMEALAGLVVYRIHLWFIALMAGAVALAIIVAAVTASMANRMRNR